MSGGQIQSESGESKCSCTFTKTDPLPAFEQTLSKKLTYLCTSATFCRRQDELEARLIEEETEKRVEEELAKRVKQLLFERKDEIEAEVLRRVEEAKKVGLVVMIGGA